MMPGIDQKKMQSIMKQMGISQTEIDAKRVIIECIDKNIVIENPSVLKIKMQGQTNFQISGDISEVENKEDNTELDIKTIIEKTGCTKKQAEEAYNKANKDLTEAILSLS
jgi:nascent polypeptide-associated complex subunit alpha